MYLIQQRTNSSTVWAAYNFLIFHEDWLNSFYKFG